MTSLYHRDEFVKPRHVNLRKIALEGLGRSYDACLNIDQIVGAKGATGQLQTLITDASAALRAVVAGFAGRAVQPYAYATCRLMMGLEVAGRLPWWGRRCWQSLRSIRVKIRVCPDR